MNRFLSLLIACLVVPAVGPQPRHDVDLLIRGGMLVDESGGKPARADVAVHGGRILRVGRLEKAGAAEVIDGTGLFVARKGMTTADIERWLAPNLGYGPR